ncbi:hypothetical protein SUDANB38_03129 [Streptomyces sp. enrichment culture]
MTRTVTPAGMTEGPHLKSRKASNPQEVRPFGRSGTAGQTAIATSARPPVWTTTCRSAVPPGTSARTVQVPSAA